MDLGSWVTKLFHNSRIRIETGPNICALRISKADPRDNGEWSCNMREDIMEMGSVAKVEVYAANQSRTFITLPDLWRDPDDIIEYVYSGHQES